VLVAACRRNDLFLTADYADFADHFFRMMMVECRFPNDGCDFGNGSGAVGGISGMTRRFN